MTQSWRKRFGTFRNAKPFLIATLCLAVLTDSLLYGAIIPLLPEYSRRFELDTVGVSALFAVFNGFQLLTTVPAGILSDRLGPRRVLAIGLVFVFLTTLLFVFSGNVVLLFVARALQGACASLTWVSALAAIPLALPTTEQGTATTVLNGMAGIGVLIAPILGGGMYELMGLAGPYVVLLGVIALDGVMRIFLGDDMFIKQAAARELSQHAALDGDATEAVGLLDDDVASDEGGSGDGDRVVGLDLDSDSDHQDPEGLDMDDDMSEVFLGSAPVSAGDPKARKPKPSFWVLVKGFSKDTSVMVLLVSAFWGSGSFAVFETFASFHLKKTFEFSPLEIGLVYAVVPLTFALGSPLAGWLSDRWPHRRRHELTVGMFSVGVLLGVTLLPQVLWVQIILFAIFGLMCALLVATAMPELNRICEIRFSTEAFGTMVGVQNGMWALGGVVMPLLAAGIASATSAEVAMAVSGAMVFVAGVFTYVATVMCSNDPDTLYKEVVSVVAAEGV
jgi:MFS family permease